MGACLTWYVMKLTVWQIRNRLMRCLGMIMPTVRIEATN